VVKKLSIFATFAAPLALMGTAAFAQDTAAPVAPAAEASAQVAVGATVYDSTGAEVGKVKSVAAPNFVIDTGKNTATLALSALGTSPKGPVLGLTREQLDTAAEKAAADAAAALASAIAVDAPVHASDGTTVIGKIAEVAEVAEADFVLDTGSTKVKMPKTSVANGTNGLFIGLTAQAFAEATKSASPPSASK
jgi:preprotein translocase subunit YajC